MRDWLTDLQSRLPKEPFVSHLHSIQRAEAVVIGESRAQIFRLYDSAGPVSYLKIEPCVDDGTRQQETLASRAERLRWLVDRLPVPQVLVYHEDLAHRYLLTTAIPGEDIATLATETDTDTGLLVHLLGEGLRQVHSVPIGDCPFDHRLTAEIARVRERVALGLVEEDNFEPEWLGLSAERLFDMLLDSIPSDEDVVITHGDYCLPNILIDGDQVSGFIDLGAAGVGDRYRDLALAQRSLLRNCGPGWDEAFFAAYGLAEPDEGKLIFYLMLDEFY